MKKYSRIVAVLCVLGFTSSPAMATGFSIVGGINDNMTSVSTGVAGVATADISGGLGYSAGFLVNFGMANHGFETGLIYEAIKTKTSVTLLGVTSATESTDGYLHIPVLYRFGGMMWSFGVGGFYEIATSSGGSSNYGLEAGPRVSFSKLFIDARYDFGLKDNSGVKTKGVVALVGIHL